MNQRRQAETPPPLPVELSMCCLVVALEERMPGISDRWLELAESETVHTEVRRLHAPVANPDLAAAMHAAVVLTQHIRLVAKAHLAPVAAKPKKGKRLAT